MQFYRRPSPIQAMSFDLDDTLYDNRPVIERLEQEMIVWLHNHHPLTATLPLNAWSKLKQDIATASPQLRHDVTLWRKMQIKHGLIQLGYSESSAETASEAAIQQVLWLRNQVDVPDNTHNVMAELAAKIPLVAITNGNVDPHRIGLGDYFQLILKAGPDGRSKPFADMFSQAAEFLELPPENILHIGDHLKTDVTGALHAGFQACWINDQKKNIITEKYSRLLPHIEINRLEELLLLPEHQ
ncbi:5-amino-6-(5-phospho-D-ribitylamino)uracil phosphatase YigB [Vibrio albus]|jgi:putative hydrolase of the HAD superfamily|uniref:5-amino-6-(5-phospho-D-ribitylamino)uracil phosphatase YigB n=1 Tax=Vibrio albus TaxID=2200953 RepID=A0A2U3B517_9VIBR|nr:5-amino-6-(5-phospho-D-ribitylamino)uracil phosphatase YigB [Vibrio albus]PWI31891.1 5-amino-6-(5-phospho-D-ribitylamino)uracil phosphatase YigB [Vibrio albus]